MLAKRRANHCWNSLVAGLMIFALTTAVYATPGLQRQSDGADFASGQYASQIEDIRVKVQGGYVRIVRSWEGGQWHWNKRWSAIELIGLQAPQQDTGPQLGNSGGGSTGFNTSAPPANLPYAIVRNGSGYVWDTVPTDYSHLAITNRSYIQGSRRFNIEGGGYTWHDRLGNSIRYAGAIIDSDTSDNDSDTSDNGYAPIMQMASYSDKNGNTVTLNRNAQGLIQSITAAGQTVLTYSYNAGRIQFITDHTGRRVEYHYTDDLLISVRDVRGEVWHYDYDETGQLTGYTDPENYHISLTIDGNGSLISEMGDDGIGKSYEGGYSKAQDHHTSRQVDSSGTVTERWYNALGHVVRVDINGETRFTVDTILSDNSTNVRKLSEDKTVRLGGLSGGRGLNIQGIPTPQNRDLIYIKTRIQTDTQGNKTRYDYDQWQNVTKISYPDGGVESRQYHPNYSFPTKITDETGIITTFSYDAHGNTIQIIEAKGLPEQRITDFSYDSHGNISQIKTHSDTDTQQTIQTFSYDAYGNLSTALDGEGNLTQYTDYDALGNLRILIDSRSKTWTSDYDGVGDTLQDSDADGTTLRYRYDKAGQLIHIIGQDNTETRIEYQGQRISALLEPAVKGTPDAQSPAAYASTFNYDNAGRLIKITDATGRSYQTQYDSYGRIQAVIDANNNTTDYHYQDNQLSQLDFPTYSESYHYNNRNDLIEQTLTANSQQRSRSRQIDRDQRSIDYTDANGNSSQESYDSLGRLIKTSDTEQGETHYHYDNRDNLIKVTDPEGRATQFAYDKNNRLISETKQHNNETTHYNYDETGNLISIISPEDEQTDLTYSDAGRLLSTKIYKNQSDTVPQKTIDYTYDTIGQLKRVDDSTTQTDYAYNAQGHLTDITTNYGPFSKHIAYSYYANGLKKSYTNPEGIEYSYHYDGNGQLQRIDIPNTGSYNINDYRWKAPTQITLPGGGQRNFDYDDTLRLTSLSYQDPAHNEQHQSTYQYDNENNITQHTSEHRQADYSYDKLYRLTDVSLSNNSTNQTDEHYTYDKVSNRTTDTQANSDWLYNTNNQLTDINSDSQAIHYQYDSNGNQISKTDNLTNQTTHYRYNSEQRLIKIELENTATQTSQIIAEYRYNPFGQRISKTAGGNTSYYLYSQEGLAAEYDETGQLIAEYHYQPHSNWMTNPVFMRTSSNGHNINTILYYHNDHSGTPQALYTQQGALKWQATYSAFGEATITDNTVTQNLRFAGQYYDQETQLHHNYFRDYNPKTGRYLQTDPIGLAGGLNSYAYVNGNPIMYVDPRGELWWFVPRLLWGVGKFIVQRAMQNRAVMVTAKIASAAGTAAGGLAIYQTATDPCLSLGDKAKLIAAEAALTLAGAKLFSAAAKASKSAPCKINCFIAGTQVHTEDGIKAIETLQVGDKVLARNEDTGETSYKAIVALFGDKNKDIITVSLTNEQDQTTEIGATPDHPFWVIGQGWTRTDKLKSNDTIASIDTGSFLTVTALARAPPQDTYNFEVEDFHSYFVGVDGAWVHNMCGDTKRTPQT